MKKFYLITLLWLLIVCQTAIAQSTSAAQLKHTQYWYLRNRLVKYFMVPGKNIGEGVPATIRNRIDCYIEDGGNGEAYDTVSNKFKCDNIDGSILTSVRGFALDFSDAPQQMGLYLATLATEYKLLKLNNQSVSNTLRELFNALWAINRWDDCETHYPWNNLATIGSSYYYPRNYQYIPNFSNLDGRCVRSDYFRGNLNDLENFPGLETKYSDWLNQNIDYYHPNPLGNPYGDVKPVTQSQSCNGSLINPELSNSGCGSLENFKNYAMLSQDHISQLLLGLAFVAKFVDINEHIGEAFQDNIFSIKEEAIEIAYRLVSYMTYNTFILKNPDNDIIPVDAGGYAQPLALGYVKAAEWILNRNPSVYNTQRIATLYTPFVLTSGTLLWTTQLINLADITVNNAWILLNLLTVGNFHPFDGIAASAPNNYYNYQFSLLHDWHPFYPLAHGLLHNTIVTTSRNAIENDLNQMPCKGPSNFCENNSGGWCTPRRYHNKHFGCDDHKGNYNGLEWMLLFNMLTLNEKLNNTNSDWDNIVYQNLMDREIIANIPIGSLGTTQNPLKISAFNSIKFIGTINPNSDIVLRAGNTIELPPGFTANPTTVIEVEPIVCSGTGYSALFKTNANAEPNYFDNLFSSGSTSIVNVNYFNNSSNTTESTLGFARKDNFVKQIEGEQHFKVYPNPFNQTINIESKQNSTVNVFNAIGACVFEEKNIQNTINTQNWPVGIYFLKLVDENQNTHTFKLLKQ